MKFTDINAALNWMNQESNPIQREGIEKIYYAMNYLGNPQKGLKVIQVTGTNGKGSTTAFLKNLFAGAGLKVGTFTSPHIEKFNERISYAGHDISDADLLRLMPLIYDLNEHMAQTKYGRLVFFEIYTCLLLLYFHEKQPDVCLIEVGIGGLNDCTNVVDAQYAVITTVALDHVDKLGDTVEAVAYQKAGIIKRGAQVFIGQLPASSVAVVEAKVEEEGAKLYQYGHEFGALPMTLSLENGSKFTYWNDLGMEKEEFRLSMLGQHQMHNAAIALMVFQHWMYDQGIELHKEKMAQDLLTTHWQGRMEKISDQPLIFIDGAHNEAGLEALKQVVETYLIDRQVTILFAGLNRKNQSAHLQILDLFPASQIYIAPFDHHETYSQAEWQNLVNEDPNPNLHVIGDWAEFIDQFEGENNQVLLVTGSLYFISQVRQYILHGLRN